MTTAFSPELSTAPVRRRVALGITLALVSVLFRGSNAVIIRHLALEGEWAWGLSRSSDLLEMLIHADGHRVDSTAALTFLSRALT